MSDEAKAVEEVARTTGKAVDATRQLGGFLARFLAPPLEQVSEMATDWLGQRRFERQVRLAERTVEFLTERGLDRPTRAVPPSIALPLIEEASLEEDDWMQDVWAQLLANAADASSGVEIKRAFVAMLSEIGPLEVRILETLYEIPEGDQTHGIMTVRLPDEAYARASSRGGLERAGLPAEVDVALGNLVRLGCISAAGTLGGGVTLSVVYQTPLGRAFVEACTAPRSRGAERERQTEDSR